MEKEVRKARRFNYTVFAVVVIFWAVIIGVIIYPTSKPLSDSVTVSGLQKQAAETNDYILAQIGDEYYQTSASEDFGGLFEFDSWELVSDRSESEKIVTLRFGELYFLDIYDNSYAVAFDEYAPSKTVSEACYTIPEGVADSVISYLREFGIVRELGDGAIGRGTFLQ